MAKETQSIVPVVKKQISPIVLQSQSLTIATPADMQKASDMRTTLKEAEKTLKEDKEKLTKPINTLLKEIRSRYTSVEDIIETSLTALNKKMGAYQTDADRLANEEQAKIAARVGAGKGHLKPETAITQMAAIDTPSTRIESSRGATEFMDVKKFEVTDLEAVPLEYMLPNEVAIRNAMRQGIQIAGVRYFTEKVPKNAR